MKILKTTKIYDNRIYLPQIIRDKLKIPEESNGEIIIFGLNIHNEIILFKNKEEKKSDRFIVSTSD